MRQGQRMRNSENTKTILYLIGSILGLAIIIFTITFFIYHRNSNNGGDIVDTKKIAELVPNNTTNETQSASNPMGKTVEESQKNTVEKSVENSISNTKKNTTTKNTTTSKNTTATNTQENQQNKEESKEEKKQLSFSMPVEGETIKKYAKDELVYSETLKEWITHTGIDIKANKTTVVKAAEEGTVSSIKNDPRYGLTVIIEHTDGMKTIYANLLTAEFVQVGEKVTKDQTIGTVGDTATFEIADEPHLHFEIWKDELAVDPSLYIK